MLRQLQQEIGRESEGGVTEEYGTGESEQKKGNDATSVCVLRLEAGHCVGALCAYLSDSVLQDTLATHILDLHSVSDWAVLQARAISLSSALQLASGRIVDLRLRDAVKKCVVALATSDRVPVCESGLRCVSSYLNHLEGDGAEMMSTLCQVHKDSIVCVCVCVCVCMCVLNQMGGENKLLLGNKFKCKFVRGCRSDWEGEKPENQQLSIVVHPTMERWCVSLSETVY